MDTPAEHADAPDLTVAAGDGRTPFVAYTEVDVLRRSIHPQTDEPLETTFVVVTQIMELHFVLIAHEWRLAMSALGAAAGDAAGTADAAGTGAASNDPDAVDAAVEALRRSVANQRSLIACWAMLDPLSPVQYNRFRDALGQASGFQSYGYRELEFLLGVRDPHLVRPHRGMPEVAAALQATLASPSLFEVATALVRQRTGEDDVVAAWTAAYAAPRTAALAEVLAAVADHHSQWRFVHYQAVRRILGDRTGTAGSSGLSWLKRAVDAPVFPELWQVRARL